MNFSFDRLSRFGTRSGVILAGMLSAGFLLSACANSPFGGNQDTAVDENEFALPDVDRDATGASVNKFLWAASLETLDFLPLDFVDPFGGVISSEWYANPEQPVERFKTTVYILDSRLRADAVRVSVFRQEFRDTMGWSDAPIDATTAAQIENAILTRARQMRLNIDE